MYEHKEVIEIVTVSKERRRLQISDVKTIQPWSELETVSNGGQVLPTGRTIETVQLTTTSGETIKVLRSAENDKELLDLCLAIMCPSPLKTLGLLR